MLFKQVYLSHKKVIFIKYQHLYILFAPALMTFAGSLKVWKR